MHKHRKSLSYWLTATTAVSGLLLFTLFGPTTNSSGAVHESGSVSNSSISRSAEIPGHTHRAETPGYAHHDPILAGACTLCPWGAIGDIVQKAMYGSGWNVRVCYSCAGSEQEVINVEKKFNGASVPYNPSSLEALGVPANEVRYVEPPPPNGPVDFGVTGPNFLWWAYQGEQAKAGPSGLPNAAPYKDLRLVATIQQPVFEVVAATAQSGIKSLSQVKQLVSEGRPVHILWDYGLLNTSAKDILSYYGLSVSAIKAAGGSVQFGITPASRKNVDVVIYTGDLSAAPEYNALYELSQRYQLNYFQLPSPLLAELANRYDMSRVTMPAGFLQGVWQPIQTVGYVSNDAVYGRCDMPNKFAYDLAKELDRHKRLLETAYEHFSYDPAQVWKAYGVPLAKGAETYYRQVGYLKGKYPLQAKVSC